MGRRNVDVLARFNVSDPYDGERGKEEMALVEEIAARVKRIVEDPRYSEILLDGSPEVDITIGP